MCTNQEKIQRNFYSIWKNAQKRERIEWEIELANTECTKNEDSDLVRLWYYVEIKNPSSKKDQQWRKACRDVKESMQRESESSRASVWMISYIKITFSVPFI